MNINDYVKDIGFGSGSDRTKFGSNGLMIPEGEASTESKLMQSDATGISGATEITNEVVISQANYDLLTPVSTTKYLIVG